MKELLTPEASEGKSEPAEKESAPEKEIVPQALRDGELDILFRELQKRILMGEASGDDDLLYDKLEREKLMRVELSQKLEGRESMEQIRENMWLLRYENSSNPSTVVFRKGKELFITDPGISWKSRGKNKDFRELRETLHANVGGVLLTHSHPDHIGNLPEVTSEDTPVYVHPKGFWSVRSPDTLLKAENVLAKKGEAPNVFPGVLADHFYSLVMKALYGHRLNRMKMEGEKGHRLQTQEKGGENLPIKEGGRRYQRFPDQPFAFDGYNVEVIHTPGHTRGEVSFWIPEDKILVGGDLIPNTHVGRDHIASLYMPEGNIYDAIESLKKIRELKPNMFIPAHGELIRSAVEIQKRVEDMLEILEDIISKVKEIKSEEPKATIQIIADKVFSKDKRFPQTSKFGDIERRTIVMSVLRDTPSKG